MIRGLGGAFLAFALASVANAQRQQVQMEGGRFVGAVGCKSSSCHGGAGEKRSQYITWARKDFHTRGFAILTNARSERMAEGLGLGSAQTSARCTSCHAPMLAVQPGRLMKTVDPQGESVSCESCHGAAESWLRGHTRPDWTYAMRVGAGMRDLGNFYVRANTCVACHQNLDADVFAAGHPALVFEMDSQSIAEPKHWRDEEGSGPRAWLTGQAVALRELSWHLTQPNPNPDSLVQWRALAWLLNKVTASEGTLAAIAATGPGRGSDEFARVQQQADALARRASEQNLGAAFANRLSRSLAALDADFVETAETPRELLWRRAQRLVLALERLADAVKRPTLTTPRPAELAALRTDLRSAEEFNPGAFATRLTAYRESLGP